MVETKKRDLNVLHLPQVDNTSTHLQTIEHVRHDIDTIYRIIEIQIEECHDRLHFFIILCQ